MRGALSGEFFEFHGKHFDFGPLRMQPVPSEPVPILVGGHSKPALRRAARVGDGWASANTDFETLKSLIEQAEARIEDSKQKTSDSSAAIQKEKEAISQLLEFANGVAGKEGAQ